MYLSSRGTTPLSTSASISHKGPPPASKTSPGQTDMGGCVRQNPAARIVAAIPQGIRLHASGSRTPHQGLSSFGHPHKGRPGSQVAQFQATTVWRYSRVLHLVRLPVLDCQNEPQRTGTLFPSLMILTTAGGFIPILGTRCHLHKILMF